jgi:hypothetical protein
MKKSLVLVLSIMLFVVLGCSMLGTKKESDDKVDTPKPGESTTETTKDADKEKDSTSDSKGSGSLNIENFNKLDFGMSYEKVKEILGSEGEETNSSQIGKNESKTYVWKGDKYERISVNFRNNELSFLNQSGLTGTSGDADVTKAKFDEVKTGMSYSEVKGIIGSDGEKTSMSKIGDTTLASYVWKGDKYASLRASFKDDKLTSKSQSNLK